MQGLEFYLLSLLHRPKKKKEKKINKKFKVHLVALLGQNPKQKGKRIKQSFLLLPHSSNIFLTITFSLPLSLGQRLASSHQPASSCSFPRHGCVLLWPKTRAPPLSYQPGRASSRAASPGPCARHRPPSLLSRRQLCTLR